MSSFQQKNIILINKKRKYAFAATTGACLAIAVIIIVNVIAAVVSDRIEKCIYENAHVALDQVEYQKSYDGLTARFDTAKARYEALDETIRSKQSRRAKIEAFLEALAKAELVDTFDTALWCGLVDFVTVHGKDDVRFTFKNGQEIRA